MGKWIDKEHEKFPNKCIGISEYGAGGDVFQQADSLIHPEPWGQWHPENWQTYYHVENWKQLSKRPFLWCKFIWCMFDFSSAGRKEGTTFGRNDKGLVTYDRKIKKDAFYFYKANWNKSEEVLYIAEKRNNKLSRPIKDITIFSNCKKTELFVNGVSMGKKEPDNTCIAEWKDIKLIPGSNHIEIHGDNKTDSCILYLEK